MQPEGNRHGEAARQELPERLHLATHLLLRGRETSLPLGHPANPGALEPEQGVELAEYVERRFGRGELVDVAADDDGLGWQCVAESVEPTPEGRVCDLARAVRIVGRYARLHPGGDPHWGLAIDHATVDLAEQRMLYQGAKPADTRSEPQSRCQAVTLRIRSDVLRQVRRLAQCEGCRRYLVGSKLGVLDEPRRHPCGGDQGAVATDRVLEREVLDRGGLEEALGSLDGAESGEVIDGRDARGLSSMQPSQATSIGRLLKARRVMPVAVTLASHRRRPAQEAVRHLEGAAAVHHSRAPVKTGR